MKRFVEDIPLNPLVCLNGVSKERLRVALMLFGQTKAVGFGIDKERRVLVFYYKDSDGMLPLPFEADINGMMEFAWQWLSNTPYPRKPNVGDNVHAESGWKVFADEQGYIEGFGDTAFCAIQPAWLLYRDSE